MLKDGEGMLESSELRVFMATHNPGKVQEIKALLKPLGVLIEVVDVKGQELQDDDLRIIAENSVLSAYNRIQKPVFVEDSGLFIDPLNGFPGPYSSYVLSKLGVKGILRLLEGIKQRRANFRSQIAYVDNSRIVKLFAGVSFGSIACEARGAGGFGFDPIFIPRGERKTYAEMTMDEKNKISHRSKSILSFAQWLLSQER